VTALGDAAVFIATNFSACRKVLWWRDNINVFGFKSNEYLLVGNDGNGPVFVSHISLVMDLAPFGQKRATQRLNVLVPQDTITPIPINPDFHGKTKYVGSPLQRSGRSPYNERFKVIVIASGPSFLQPPTILF
jgi:hypothetical protein